MRLFRSCSQLTLSSDDDYLGYFPAEQELAQLNESGSGQVNQLRVVTYKDATYEVLKGNEVRKWATTVRREAEAIDMDVAKQQSLLNKRKERAIEELSVLRGRPKNQANTKKTTGLNRALVEIGQEYELIEAKNRNVERIKLTAQANEDRTNAYESGVLARALHTIDQPETKVDDAQKLIKD